LLTNNKIKLAPSVLSADFGRLGEQVAEAAAAGADYIHVDVMDGLFVPNITVGPLVVNAIHRWTKLPLDVHLMIKSPEHHIKAFAEAGANIITVHIETCPHVNRIIHQIKDLGIKAGIALNPGTPSDMISEVIAIVDLVLVMTVNPGFGGQSFIPESLSKISRISRELMTGNTAAELEVDGGINSTNARSVVQAGAQVLVAGAAVYNSTQTVADALLRIRNNATSS
jgi:ribulose-phosphate 3-epimerase